MEIDPRACAIIPGYTGRGLALLFCAMSVIPGQDLISLGSLFASNLDDAAFVARRSETEVRLAALRRERETLESSARRRHEVEVHVNRMRRLSLEQRLNSLQSGALRPPDSAPAAPSRSSFLEHPHSAAAQLEAARQRFSDRVRAEYPAWSVARQAVQVEAATAVRDELLQVEKRRAVANEGFQAEMTVEAALARERQRVQLARTLEREEARAHEQLRRALLGTGGAAAASTAPPATSALPSNAADWAGALPAMLAAAAATWPTSQTATWPTSQTVRPTGPLASTAPATAPVALPAAPPLAAPEAAVAAAAVGVMPMAPVAAMAQAARAQAARAPTAGQTAAVAAVPPPAADAASPDTWDDEYDVSALRRAVGVAPGVAPALMADAATDMAPDMAPARASFVPIGDEEADGDFGEGGRRYGAASGAYGGAAPPYASSHACAHHGAPLTSPQVRLLAWHHARAATADHRADRRHVQCVSRFGRHRRRCWWRWGCRGRCEPGAAAGDGGGDAPWLGRDDATIHGHVRCVRRRRRSDERGAVAVAAARPASDAPGSDAAAAAGAAGARRSHVLGRAAAPLGG